MSSAVSPAKSPVKSPASSPASSPAAPRGDPLAGRDKADAERCLECHGVAGPGQGYSNGSDGKFARLGGQQADYIVKQVLDFRSGRRKHDFMQMMARTLSDEDLRDIAAYFAAEPKMAAGAAPPANAVHSLYQGGDAARNLAACAGCHGARGEGLAGGGPALGGQGLHYLEQQLENWRSGTRANSAGGVMNQMIKPLSDAEIASMAHYLSGM
ncbi:MAG: c-type cytochrome [Massilia sp.]